MSTNAERPEDSVVSTENAPSTESITSSFNELIRKLVSNNDTNVDYNQVFNDMVSKVSETMAEEVARVGSPYEFVSNLLMVYACESDSTRFQSGVNAILSDFRAIETNLSNFSFNSDDEDNFI